MVLESISRQSSTEAVVERRHSGYEVLLVDPLPQRLKCPLCKKLMRNPIQTYRGELACEYCYQHHQNNTNVCPIDHEPISPGSIHRDKFQEHVINMLPCYCIYKKHGCNWKGIVSSVDNHYSECQFRPYFIKLREQLPMLENAVQELSDINEKISKLVKNTKDSQKAFLLSNEMEHIKSAGNNDLNNEVNTSLMSDINEKIATLDSKLQLLENTTYDGKILWKIDNFSYRMQQAVTGRVTALHSAPCFTSRHGYKFCARLYLNGDGLGKCSHVSLFIVLMKSEYDDLLDWPFNKYVMLRLINQEDYSKSIHKNFTSDVSSPSFQKPTEEMNIAAGCPLFVPKKMLLHMKDIFVKDDTVFIEISVR